MRFSKWKCKNYLQITQPTPSVIISFLKQVKTKVNGLLMMWHEGCVCVCLSFVSALTSNCFRSLSTSEGSLWLRRSWAERRKWVPRFLLHIEHNHTSTTRASRQWKAWHIGLKQHHFFPQNCQISLKYWGDAGGSVDSMVHWEPWTLHSLAIC